MSGTGSMFKAGSNPLDIAFHPCRSDEILLGLVDGSLELRRVSDGGTVMRMGALMGECAARVVDFGLDGSFGVCGGSDGTLAIVDVDRVSVKDLKRVKRKSGSAVGISAVHVVGNEGKLIAVGEDLGMVRLWDTRTSSYVMKRHDHKDYVSSMCTVEGSSEQLFSAGADGKLGVWDLREGSDGSDPVLKLKAISIGTDDELLSVCALRGGRKVVCGTSEGVLNVYSSKNWSDYSERIPGHPLSVESMIKVDEDTILTGSIDGIIRVVQIQPGKLLGIVGDHGDLPIERLSVSCDQRQLASCSHDDYIRIHDVAYLYHEEEENEGDKKEEVVKKEEEKEEVKLEFPVTSRHKKRRKGSSSTKRQTSSSFFADL